MIRWATKDQLAPRFRPKLRNKRQKLFHPSKRTWNLQLHPKRMLLPLNRRVLLDQSRLHALVQDPCLIPAQELHQRALLLFNPKRRSSRCLPADSKSQTAPESQDQTPRFLDIQSEKRAIALVSIQPNFSSKRIVWLRSKGNMKKSPAFLKHSRTTKKSICRPNKARMSKSRQIRSQLRTKWCSLDRNFP